MSVKTSEFSNLSVAASFENASAPQMDMENKKTHAVALEAFAARNFIYRAIHTLIGYLIVPAQLGLCSKENCRIGKNALRCKFGGESIEFKAADGTQLDGMFFQGSQCSKNARTVILFNGNGVRYEEYGLSGILLDIEAWQKNKWNVVVFNYRGVGESKGSATRDGLILDGEAALDYVKTKHNLPEHKILLHGQSLGGGVASEVAANHPQVNYCNDRSFSSLSKEVKVFLGNGYIGDLASKILVYFGWEYNARANWDKMEGVKFSVYHERDSVIPLGARFHEMIEDNNLKLKMASLWYIGDRELPDDPDLVDARLRDPTTPPQVKSQLKTLRKQTGSVAHMRKFMQHEEFAYFERIKRI